MFQRKRKQNTVNQLFAEQVRLCFFLQRLHRYAAATTGQQQLLQPLKNNIT
jgi:hypothetical protein